MVCIVSVGIFFSCKDKTVDYGYDRYYVEIVTAQNGNEFLSDNGKRIVATSNENLKTYAFGERVLLNYTLLSTTDSGDSYNVRINGSSKISSGKISLTNDSVIRSAATDPIRLESVWLGSHYINMHFYLNFKSEAHKIGLLIDSTRLGSDTLRMYFTHDTGADPPGYPVQTYLSFDLSATIGAPGKARPIWVQMNTSNYGNKAVELKY